MEAIWRILKILEEGKGIAELSVYMKVNEGNSLELSLRSTHAGAPWLNEVLWVVLVSLISLVNFSSSFPSLTVWDCHHTQV